MSHIKELFPKPIYVVENICVNLIPQFCSIIYDVIDKKGSKTTDFQYVESTHSTFDDFYNIKQFEPLVKEIQNHSYNFLLALGYSDEQISKMKLRNLWANISKEGSYLFPHIHSNSVLSGAYYLKSSQTDKIQFYNDIADTTFNAAYAPAINSRIYEETCIPGKLLIFKSNLPHGTTIKKDSWNKVSMSFNIVFNNEQ